MWNGISYSGQDMDEWLVRLVEAWLVTIIGP
jgi:hypothetical protein